MSQSQTKSKRPVYVMFLSFYAFSALLLILAYLQQGIIFKALCDLPLETPKQTNTRFIQQSAQANLTELLSEQTGQQANASYLLLNPVEALNLDTPLSLEYYELAGMQFISQITQDSKLIYTPEAFEQQREQSCSKDRNQSQRFYGASLLLFLFAGVLLWRRFKYGQPNTAEKLLEAERQAKAEQKDQDQ